MLLVKRLVRAPSVLELCLIAWRVAITSHAEPGHTVWQTLPFGLADAKPDPVTALTSSKYVRTYEEKIRIAAEEGLAQIFWVASNCEQEYTGRTRYMAELMRHIKVDSMGRCLHNKEIPASLKDWSTLGSDKMCGWCFSDSSVLHLI